jgi:iron complex transport system ATP-binding protein
MDGVSAGYGGKRVLSGISARFPAGSLACLLGPNGSGKSTMLRLLGGALPFSGEVSINGQSLRQLPASRRGRLVGVVSQSPAMLFPFTVEEVILLGRLPHRTLLSGWTREDRERAASAAHEMELGSLLFRKVSSLSGGEKQRALIAQVIAQRPEVFLLDEPSSALDPRHTLRLFRFLRRCAGEGKTVIVAVHDINLAAEFADIVCFLKGGSLAAIGCAGETLSEAVLSEVYDVSFSSFETGTPCAFGGERGRKLWRAL